VTLVLELDLGDAVGVDPRGTHLVDRRARLPVERPPDRFHEIALAAAVGAVDADQAGGDLEVERPLVHPVVPEVETGHAH